MQSIMARQELYLEASVAGDEDALGIIWVKRIRLLPVSPMEVVIMDCDA